MVLSGVLAPGDWLPSETELAETQGIARETIRSGLRILQDEGLIVAIPKRGRYVAERKNWRVQQ
jgi:GntR family transcriptional regulator, transcriptional repressor for pyruvate dehydrogenase complex